MSIKATSFLLALLLTLSSVYAARRSLDSFEDLRDCHLFEHTNLLELLHWFANKVNIGLNTIELTFDPDSDYGSHRYRNDERILEQPPAGYQYYTVGNINRYTSKPLPSCVVDAQSGSTEWNKARIVFLVRQGTSEIDEVHITQHYSLYERHGSSYDREHTYRVTTNLLRELRSRPFNEIPRLASRVQIETSGDQDNSHLQEFSYSNQLQTRNYHATENTCNTCVWITCALVISIIFIIIIALGVHFARRK